MRTTRWGVGRNDHVSGIQIVLVVVQLKFDRVTQASQMNGDVGSCLKITNIREDEDIRLEALYEVSK